MACLYRHMPMVDGNTRPSTFGIELLQVFTAEIEDIKPTHSWYLQSEQQRPTLHTATSNIFNQMVAQWSPTFFFFFTADKAASVSAHVGLISAVFLYFFFFFCWKRHTIEIVYNCDTVISAWVFTTSWENSSLQTETKDGPGDSFNHSDCQLLHEMMAMEC